MPTYINHHSRRIVRARVTVQGRTRTKKYPDDSRKSFRAAVQWEENTKQKILEEIRSELQAQTNTVFCSIAIQTWQNTYLNDAKTRYVKKTYKEKKFAFQQLADLPQVNPNTPVEDITIDLAGRLIGAIKKMRSGHSANKVRKNLATAWNWAARNWPDAWPGKANPFAAVDKMPEEQKPRYVPPIGDFWKVYAAADTLQDRVILQIFIQTAARRKEVFSLRFDDLDFENSLIRLWTRKRTGGKEFDWVPMTGTLRRDLLDWIEYRMRFSDIDPNHVFVCLDRYKFALKFYGKPFQHRQHLMRRLCKRAGVPHFGFHAIRHLTAACLYRQGETIATIQEILRHKSATTTAKYLKSLGLDVETSRAALEKIVSAPAEVVEFPEKKNKKGPGRGSQK